MEKKKNEKKVQISSTEILQTIGNPIRSSIITALDSEKKSLRFSELMKASGLNPLFDSGHFNYHLTELMEIRVIIKMEDRYILSDFGCKLSKILSTVKQEYSFLLNDKEGTTMLQYPKEYEKTIVLHNGTKVLLRPELSTDTDMLWDMYSTLSKESLRYMYQPQGYTREIIQQWTSTLDHTKSLIIVAVIEEGGKKRIIAAVMLRLRSHSSVFKHKGYFGILVHDDYQNRGLGTILTQYVLDIAKDMSLRKVWLRVSTDNSRVVHMFKKCGFKIVATLKEDVYVDGNYLDSFLMEHFLL